MEITPANEARKELILVLMYLSRFAQPRVKTDQEPFFTWKGYDFEILKELDEAELICLGSRPSRTKTAYLTDSGLEYGKKLLEKYGIQD